MSEKKIEQK